MAKEKAVEESAEVGEPTQATESVEDLRAKIADLEAEVSSAKSEAKAHQEYGRKIKAELDKQRGLEDRISQIEDNLRVSTDMLADLIDRNEEDLETPRSKGRKSEEYTSRIRESEKKRDEEVQREFYRLANEADKLLSSVGLQMDKSPETAAAYVRSGRRQHALGHTWLDSPSLSTAYGELEHCY